MEEDGQSPPYGETPALDSQPPYDSQPPDDSQPPYDTVEAAETLVTTDTLVDSEGDFDRDRSPTSGSPRRSPTPQSPRRSPTPQSPRRSLDNDFEEVATGEKPSPPSLTESTTTTHKKKKRKIRRKAAHKIVEPPKADVEPPNGPTKSEVLPEEVEAAETPPSKKMKQSVHCFCSHCVLDMVSLPILVLGMSYVYYVLCVD